MSDPAIHIRARPILRCALLSLFLLVRTGPASASEDTDLLLHEQVGDAACGTTEMYKLAQEVATSSEAGGLCPVSGDCDIPAVRNSWFLEPDDSTLVIKLFFNVFRNDDGSGALATEEDVANAVAALNRYYEPYGFQFEYRMRFVNDSRYRVCSTYTDFPELKYLYAVAPDSQCNIYVVYVDVNGSHFCFGTMPWDARALRDGGGIVMHYGYFPPNSDIVLAHEMGHNLGLLHIFTGVSEVEPCSECYEYASGFNGDIAGDFCSDTKPTPRNATCLPPGGADCRGDPWGETTLQNYMNYGPSYCGGGFTTQQVGRMRCWANDILWNWIVNVRVTADTVLGSPPFEVQFTGSTPRTVMQWEWEFGDGGTSDEANPAHVYAEPGHYDVAAAIQAAEGDYNTINPGYIWVQADSMRVEPAYLEYGKSVGVDVYARNYVPVRVIDIPFAYDGPCDLTLDSISRTGLRTEYLDFGDKISGSAVSKYATYRMRSISAPQLAPGSGPIATLWFTAGNLTPGLSNDVRFIEYGSLTHYEPKFTVDVGEYNPVTIDGSLQPCVAGDVNGDGSGGDPTDLSAFVDLLFGGSQVPINEVGADCNNDGDVDPVDLSYLVDFLFAGGPRPVC